MASAASVEQRMLLSSIQPNLQIHRPGSHRQGVSYRQEKADALEIADRLAEMHARCRVFGRFRPAPLRNAGADGRDVRPPPVSAIIASLKPWPSPPIRFSFVNSTLSKSAPPRSSRGGPSIPRPADADPRGVRGERQSSRCPGALALVDSSEKTQQIGVTPLVM